MNTTPLKAFIALVPVCLQTATIAEAIERFCHSNGERLVVLNECQQPVGLVNLDKLISYLISNNPTREGAVATQRKRPLFWQQPISQISLSVVEPIETIPADLSWHQYQSYRRSLISNGPYALADKDGTFLGLLDSKRLLKYLLVKEKQVRASTAEPWATLASQLYRHPKIERESSIEIEKEAIAPNSLATLLESLPIPLMLTLATGEIAIRNRAWRRSLGAFPNPNAGKQAVATFLKSIPLGYSSERSPSYRSPDTASESGERLEMLPEKSWQFVKIPLDNASENSTRQELALWEQAIFTSLLAAVKTGRQSAVPTGTLSTAGGDRSPWLVLATKMTLTELEVEEIAAKIANLEQLNQQKDEFLASIGHELKTPLTALLGLSSLLKNDSQNSLNERQANYARLIHNSGRQMMRTLNDLLDLSRLDTERLELIRDPVEIATVCDRAYQQVKQSIADRLQDASVPETRFILKIAPGLEAIVADELRLRQMLVNLLSNALKFTELTGEVGLRVSQWSQKWIGFTVWDTGVGIEASQQSSIFQKFQKLDNPLTQHPDSTGLGMILTQRLARLHGGDVTFASLKGHGSQFTLLLPAPEKQLNDEKFPISHYRQFLTVNSLVLLVETDPQLIWDLTALLRNKGYQCAVARSTEEALHKAQRLQPRAVFLNLAETNGYLGIEVLTRLKSEASTRHIRAIALGRDAAANSTVPMPADGFLSVPVESHALELQIGSAIAPPPASPPLQNSLPQLTILCLSPNNGQLLHQTDRDASSAEMGNLLCAWELHSLLGQEHRIVEASDLDQAELLAKIWKPNVVLLNDCQLSSPLVFLQELREREILASLPLVTLTPETTQAANQLMRGELLGGAGEESSGASNAEEGLSVFPCLVPPGSLPESSTLLQVIQVAAGFSNRYR